MDFEIEITGDLQDDGEIFYALPYGYKWDYPNPQGTVSASCVAGTTFDDLTKYTKFT